MVITADTLNIPAPVHTPDVDKITTESINGTGIFDKLMRTMVLHLDKQYQDGRITGKEYAQVYLGVTTAMLEQSVNLLVQDQNVAKINADIALTRQQIVTELAQTDDTIPQSLGFNGDTSIEGLLAAAKATEQQRTLLTTEEVAKVTAETLLTEQQFVTELAQTDDLIPAQYGQNSSVNVLGIMEATKNKIQQDADLAEQKVVSELIQTSDTMPSSLGKNPTTTIGGILKAAQDRTNAEVSLIKQKTASELAQTDDTIPAGVVDTVPAGYTVAGVLKSQKDLFVQQKEGFVRDAEQKAAKMLIDTWNVRKTTDDTGTSEVSAGMSDGEIKKVVDKMKTGIGVTPA